MGLLMSLSSSYAQMGNMPDFKPSDARAERMTTLSNFSAARNFASYPTEEVYANESGMDLHVYITSGVQRWGRQTTAAPCIIFIQGSAWGRQNVKASVPRLMEFARLGYTIVSVEYRPSEVAQWPAQLLDVKTAIRYVRTNAERLGIDPGNIFVWGDSSGGHMSLMVGLTQDHPELDTDQYGKESVMVNAVVAYYPVTDLLRIQEFAPASMDHISAESPTGVLFGRRDVMSIQDEVAKASPVNYVETGKQKMPFLIMYGDSDRTLPFEQGVLIADKMEECGYDYAFYKLTGAGHGSYEFWTPEVFFIVDNFIRANMK